MNLTALRRLVLMLVHARMQVHRLREDVSHACRYTGFKRMFLYPFHKDALLVHLRPKPIYP